MAVRFKRGVRLLLVSALPCTIEAGFSIIKLGEIPEAQFKGLLHAGRLETGISFGEPETLQMSWKFKELFDREMRWYDYDSRDKSKDKNSRPAALRRGDYILLMRAAYRSGG